MGCPLRCLWCSNPETQLGQSQILSDSSKCLNCGACKTICPDEVCRSCGSCIIACPAKARSLTGQKASVQGVMEEILRDIRVRQGEWPGKR